MHILNYTIPIMIMIIIPTKCPYFLGENCPQSDNFFKSESKEPSIQQEPAPVVLGPAIWRWRTKATEKHMFFRRKPRKKI